MIRMGFCGISGKRLWVKSDRHIIKPNHGVEQTQVLQTVATEFSCSFDGYMIINYKSGSLVKRKHSDLALGCRVVLLVFSAGQSGSFLRTAQHPLDKVRNGSL